MIISSVSHNKFCSMFLIHDVSCLLGSARHQKAVIGVSVVLFLLLFLLILFLLRLRHQSKDRKGGEQGMGFLGLRV